MKIFFCKEMGFYNSSISSEIPCDSIEITKEKWVELLRGQAEGKQITADEDGNPVLIEQEKPPINELSQTELKNKLSVTNQQIAIIKPAVDGGYAKPEHTQLLADWQRYRYELTLVPEQPGWPESPQWPTEPDKVI